MTDTTTPAEPTAEHTNPAETAAPDPAAEVARLQELLTDSQKENKKHREGKAEAKAATAAQKAINDAQLLENGEFKALAESLQAEAEALRAYKAEVDPLLSAAKADQEARKVSLEQRISSLSEGDQSLVLGSGSLANQEALAQRLLGAKPVANQVPGTNTGSAGSSGVVVDSKDMAAMWALRQSDPVAYHKALAASNKPARNAGSLGFLSRGKK